MKTLLNDFWLKLGVLWQGAFIGQHRDMSEYNMAENAHSLHDDDLYFDMAYSSLESNVFHKEDNLFED